MSTTGNLRRTPLYESMLRQGGKMVDFHGWELPVQFGGIIEEHKAVRNNCGIFDVSHMGQVFVKGKDAAKFVQLINANNMPSVPGKGAYSHVLNDNGGLVDDVIGFCRAPESYLIVVNSATTDKDFAWFRKHAAGLDVTLSNESDKYGMVAVQGPKAMDLIKEFAPGISEVSRFGIMETQLFGEHVFIVRTGYTGEDGVEIMASPSGIVKIWDDILSRGLKYGIKPCGLGSRDVLRLEAGYLLYGQDVDDDHTSHEAGYGWVVKFKKEGGFIGREAALKKKEAGLKTRLTGFILSSGGVPRPGCAVYKDGVKIGALNSATFSPYLSKGIGVGYVSVVDMKEGEAVEIEIHSRRIAAKVAKVPFYPNRV